ncbi:MAG: MFS transporter [Nocardioides sp.]|uniref:MFS transporter n=1 Tax=Nocardioides sp. TaxID=35761 RepID=UPI0039E5838E
MTELNARQLLRRFLLITATRWLPVGLLAPVLILLPLHRGLGLAETGTAYAVQGFVVLALELPTGGFADSLGRRPVMLVATMIGTLSYCLFLVADSFWLLVTFSVLQGLQRSLDSGTLEAWYVDAVHKIDPDARLEGGMSAQGAAVGAGVAVGAVLSGALVALDPVPAIGAFVVPVVIGLVFQTLSTVAVVAWMQEHRLARVSGLVASVWETPRAIGDGIALLRGSRVLLALLCVELFWGFGMVTFDSLLPVRLSEVSGGTQTAASITGPAMSAAWAASAVGAATASWFAHRAGTALTAGFLRVLQGGLVVLLGALGGVPGILTAYLACYVVHGSSNALHSALLHRQVGPRTRATVISLNSMFAQPAGSIGLIVLTGVADQISTSAAMFVGGAILAVAAPLYLPAWRQERAARTASPEPVVTSRVSAV